MKPTLADVLRILADKVTFSDPGEREIIDNYISAESSETSETSETSEKPNPANVRRK